MFKGFPLRSRAAVEEEEAQFQKTMNEYIERQEKYRVTKSDNWRTGWGEASLRGIQNNDRGIPYHEHEDDLNHKDYFSSNLVDKYGDAQFKYTLSTRPQGPVKVTNLNYKLTADPLPYH